MIGNKQVTIGAGTNTQVSSTRLVCKMAIIQANGTHAARVGDASTTTTKGAGLLANGANQVVLGPFATYDIDLSHLYVAGTAADVIDVTYVF